MKYSHNWLQEYIEEKLPDKEVLENVISAKAFEVESVEKISYKEGGTDVADYIYDIKVLPNRAHDALSHAYMALEICACLNLNFKKEKLDTNLIKNKISNVEKSNKKVELEAKDKKSCSKFMAVRIDGIRVQESGEQIKNRLESVGERSINNIVDITNYVQYSINKPVHAYDADEVDGTLRARYAKADESLVTLDDRQLKLDPDTLVIGDDKKVLGLAGIKGGKHSGIKNTTTSIIIESANFDATLIRKTSQKYNIRTDASKRFENSLHDSLVEAGLFMVVDEILRLFPDAQVSEIADTNPVNYRNYKTGITRDSLNSILGTHISEQDMENMLSRLNFNFKKVNTLEKMNELVETSLGAEYKRGASVINDAPKLFDCSSLINYIYKESHEHVPRMSIDQYVFCRKVKREELRYGDLIFTNTNNTKSSTGEYYSKLMGKMIAEQPIRTNSVEFMRGTEVAHGIDHVGMYVGDNKVLHAASSIGKVAIEDVDQSKVFSGEKYFGRPFENLEGYSYIVDVPLIRLDLRTKEDVAEEVGRIYGFENLNSSLPVLDKQGTQHKVVKLQAKLRDVMLGKNYSEVITYSLDSCGEIELVKSASDKNKLRTSIESGLRVALEKNLNNMPLLGLDTVRFFEIGSVFNLSADKKCPVETLNLCVLIDDNKKKSNFEQEVKSISLDIENAFNITNLDYKLIHKQPAGKVIGLELNLTKILDKMSGPNDAALSSNVYLNDSYIRQTKYKTFSELPFVVRDVAFWCDEAEDKEQIEKSIKENAGELCVSVSIFDEFVKDVDGIKRKSLGYRLIYQDKLRTLTDDEVNGYAKCVYDALSALGYEVR